MKVHVKCVMTLNHNADVQLKRTRVIVLMFCWLLLKPVALNEPLSTNQIIRIGFLFSDPHFQWGEKSSSVLRFFFQILPNLHAPSLDSPL